MLSRQLQTYHNIVIIMLKTFRFASSVKILYVQRKSKFFKVFVKAQLWQNTAEEDFGHFCQALC